MQVTVVPTIARATLGFTMDVLRAKCVGTYPTLLETNKIALADDREWLTGIHYRDPIPENRRPTRELGWGL